MAKAKTKKAAAPAEPLDAQGLPSHHRRWLTETVVSDAPGRGHPEIPQRWYAGFPSGLDSKHIATAIIGRSKLDDELDSTDWSDAWRTLAGAAAHLAAAMRADVGLAPEQLIASHSLAMLACEAASEDACCIQFGECMARMQYSSKYTRLTNQRTVANALRAFLPSDSQDRRYASFEAGIGAIEEHHTTLKIYERKRDSDSWDGLQRCTEVVCFILAERDKAFVELAPAHVAAVAKAMNRKSKPISSTTGLARLCVLYGGFGATRLDETDKSKAALAAFAAAEEKMARTIRRTLASLGTVANDDEDSETG
jgi:hypothetical protein